MSERLSPAGPASGPLLVAARYLVRRLLSSSVALLGVVAVVFVLSHGFGDPVALLVGPTGSADQIRQLRSEYGFDRPLIVQFWDYLVQLLHGDLGMSYFSRRPVSAEIGTYFPATFELALFALVIGVGFAVPLGFAAALRPRSWASRVATAMVRFGVAMPSFWLGIILLLVFVYHWSIFPAPSGELDIGTSPPPDVTGMVLVDALLAGQMDVAGEAASHLVLPAVTLALTSFSALISLTRATVAEILASDHVRAARALGLSPRVLNGRYVARNIVPVVLTQSAMIFGYLLGGTVLVETAFSWPGLGRFAVTSMDRLDYAPVMGIGIFSALIYLILYLFADVVSLLTDPRIRHDR